MADMDGSQNHMQEASMSHFIKTQLMMVLQPFIDHVESNDKRITKLEDELDDTNNRITNTNLQVDTTNTTLKGTIDNLRQTDRRVEALGEGLRKCADHMDQMQRGLEFSNEYAERIHNQTQVVSGQVPELQRSCDEVEKMLQSLQVNFQRLSDQVMAAHTRRLDSLAEDMSGVKTTLDEHATNHDQLKGRVQEEARALHDAQEELQMHGNAIAANSATLRDVLKREEEMSGRIEGCKSHLNKLQPNVDGLKKDAVFLKQSVESHGASIHGLQRGLQSLLESTDDLQGKAARMSSDIDTIHRNLKEHSQSISDAQDAIGSNTAFANKLHTRLDNTDAELSSTQLALKGLEGKHQTLSDTVERNAETQAQMLQDQRRANDEAATTRRELDKTNDHLNNTVKRLEETSRGLVKTNGDVGHVQDAVSKLQGELEAMQGGMVGLQKGFMQSGLEMGPAVTAKKQERLPRVPGASPDTRRPNTSRDSNRIDDATTAASRMSLGGASRMSPTGFSPNSTQQSMLSAR